MMPFLSPARWVQLLRRCGAMGRARRGEKHAGGMYTSSIPAEIAWMQAAPRPGAPPRPPIMRKRFVGPFKVFPPTPVKEDEALPETADAGWTWLGLICRVLLPFVAFGEPMLQS